MGRMVVVLLAASACARAPADPNVTPAFEWICVGRTPERELRVKVWASTLEQAGAEAIKQYPGLVNPACTPNPAG